MGYIGSDGQYHKGAPPMLDMVQSKTTVWKQSDHDRQRADHKGDLVKPYLSNGEPNPEYIDLYPEEAKHVYKFIKTDDQIAKDH